MSNLLFSIDEAAKALSIGKTKLYAELKDGKIKAIKIGKRTLIKKDSLEEYIQDLDTYPSHEK